MILGLRRPRVMAAANVREAAGPGEKGLLVPIAELMLMRLEGGSEAGHPPLGQSQRNDRNLRLFSIYIYIKSALQDK
jgi:hypothetical protein